MNLLLIVKKNGSRQSIRAITSHFGWVTGPNPTQVTALRYIGILGWHLVVTLEYDPQFDGIKM